MENNGFEKVGYDYYSNTPSYVKIILDMLPECVVQSQKKLLVKELYNSILNSSNESEIREIVALSVLFRQKMNTTNMDELNRFVKYTYELYIERLLSDYTNRGIIFDKLKDCMMLFIGNYSRTFELENELSANVIGGR